LKEKGVTPKNFEREAHLKEREGQLKEIERNRKKLKEEFERN
jgi:hypothetical protein